jgi:hypothetical protein
MSNLYWDTDQGDSLQQDGVCYKKKGPSSIPATNSGTPNGGTFPDDAACFNDLNNQPVPDTACPHPGTGEQK